MLMLLILGPHFLETTAFYYAKAAVSQQGRIHKHLSSFQKEKNLDGIAKPNDNT